MGSQGGENAPQGGSWKTRQSHICEETNQEELLGSQTDYATQGSSTVKEVSRPLAEKNLWGLRWQEKLPASQEFAEETHKVPRTYTKPPTRESAPEGPNVIVGSRGK